MLHLRHIGCRCTLVAESDGLRVADSMLVCRSEDPWPEGLLDRGNYGLEGIRLKLPCRMTGYAGSNDSISAIHPLIRVSVRPLLLSGAGISASPCLPVDLSVSPHPPMMLRYSFLVFSSGSMSSSLRTASSWRSYTRTALCRWPSAAWRAMSHRQAWSWQGSKENIRS